MTTFRQIRCPYCRRFNVQKRGKRDNKNRLFCNDCQKSFTSYRPDISAANRFVWFRQWVEFGHTIKYIFKRSGYSERTLKRYFYDCLKNHPTWYIRPSEKVNLLIDGTYFANKVCLVLYQDHNVKATQIYRLTDGEWLDEIKEDLGNLIELGIRIESVTCDGARKHHQSCAGVCPRCDYPAM